jgi:glycopeptide antibiotics resistance protein
MSKNNRFSYFTLIIFTVILGILSRKSDSIPSFFGDILYAVMVYFGMCFLFPNYDQKKAIILALLFCYYIEFLQLYRAQ